MVIAALLLLPASATTAAAAIRFCSTAQLGEVAQAPTELEARRQALASWRNKAARAGRAFTNWRLAIKKSSRCARLKDGRYTCVAFAVPCRLMQVPPRKSRPKGLMPAPAPGKLPGTSGTREI